MQTIEKEKAKEIIREMYDRYGWVAKKGLEDRLKAGRCFISYESVKKILKELGFSYQKYACGKNPAHVWTIQGGGDV